MSIFKKLFGDKGDQPAKPEQTDRVFVNGKEVSGDQKIEVRGQQIDVNALIQQARGAQSAGMQQMEAQKQFESGQISMSQMMEQIQGNQSAATMGAMDAPAATAPKTQFVKKTQCHACGAAKMLPTKTAYVYCDFCSGLTDYDFQKACENLESMKPGPAYMQLVQSMQTDIAAAKQAKNADTFRGIQKQLFSKWVEVCPNAVSPRAKTDAAYRQQLVDYMAECAVTNEFDPTYQAFADTVKTQTGALVWTGTFPKTTVSGETFWPLFKTVREQTDYSFGIMKAAGVLAKHPDDAPEELQRKMTWSMFCQGWIPWLDTESSEKMIADVGLKGEYTEMEPKETTLRHCGGCGGELHVIPGAKAVLCEDCGTRVDVTADEVNCSNCAGLISFPVGQNRVTCPFCKSEARRMGF